MEWSKQREERRRLNRGTRLNLTKSYHTCWINCDHGSSLPTKPTNSKKTSFTGDSKGWFQKYAELNLIEMGAGVPEVNAVPKMEQNSDFETITVTVVSGAYNTVGPLTTGKHFKVTPTEASAKCPSSQRVSHPQLRPARDYRQDWRGNVGEPADPGGGR